MNDTFPCVGDDMYSLAERLFPINRSLTGDGVRQSFGILSELVTGLQVHEVPTGTSCFDWSVPKEWKIREGWIEDPNGDRIADFANCNLHVVGYSTPVDTVMGLDELQQHLYSLPEQPDAIPYVTSYYKERWGFCLTENQRRSLQPGNYRVRIDSELFDGSLTYGELKLAGDSEKEIFLSTYVCHPSMANNELSGPCVTIHLAKWLQAMTQRRYSYRIVFIPETIGSIVYLSRHHEAMRKNVVAGFNVSCVGDDRVYSYLPSRDGDTLSDRVAKHVLHHTDPDYCRYTFLDRGSDERQYCSPGIDLPVATVMRSKYGMYPEYHTSHDNLDVISPSGLQGAFNAIAECIRCIEQDCYPKSVMPCEPQLGRRGLYPDLSVKGGADSVREMMNMIAYCDGKKSLLEIAEIIDAPMSRLTTYVKKLVNASVIETQSEKF
ncbi:DUF4910 domain-containing protein [Rubripirellula amarantea]|nr:DUF4910 domain-containing protein [Rubripirellula amarantea]